MIIALSLAALAGPAVNPPQPRGGPPHSLMPVPASLEWKEGRLRLDSVFAVTPAAGRGAGDSRLERAVARFRVRLAALTGLPQGRGGPGLTLDVKRPSETIQSPAEDESYVLDVAAGGARLDAATTVGALRGLETLLQLIAADSAGWAIPAVHIADRPRFPWRGLLIDVGRHWQPPEVIKRQLDGMAAVKLNVLHWHLSEDQGFRVESRLFPLLQEKGSDGLYYTSAQIREIVAYARDRGIRVVPEFDMPGHSTAWFAGYPGYASAPGPYAIERRFGVFPPTFDPTREVVYRFLDRFIGEMAALFPDRYWHIGGDEVEGSQWKQSRPIQAFMKAHRLRDNAALQAYFNRRLSAILTRHGKRMVGWDEILHPELPTTTVVQSWRGRESLGQSAKDGYGGILSAGYYLDQMETTEDHYLVDPIPEGSELTAEAAARILGGEACMWGEHVTSETIDSRIWPRLAAVAERLWSPQEVKDVADMYRRLAPMRVRLEALGLSHESHTARMARRLANGGDASALLRLLSLAEPVRFGERSRLQQLTQMTPLVGAIDAARPDPPSRWELRARAADALLAGATSAQSRERLAAAFAGWPQLAAGVDSLGPEAPLARDAAPAAHALARAGEIGSEALAWIGQGPAPAYWVRAQLAALDSLELPQGLLRVTAIPAIRLLVQGAAPR
jgi:hexosaminidase